jgi:gliding motility-associated protein GldE
LELSWIAFLTLFIFLFTLSAFFSGSEVALFSIDEKRLKFINEKNPYAAKLIARLLEYPRKILIAILIGNNIANVGISLTAAFLTVKLASFLNFNLDILLAIEIIALTIFLLIIAEIFPKILANKYPVEFSMIAAYPLSWVFTLFAPITFLFFHMTRLLQRRITNDRKKIALSSDELKTLADLGKEQGAIEKEEHTLIHSIIEFGDTTVREVMTTRTDMVALDITSSFETVIQSILAHKRSRIPIYRDEIDKIEGILYAKDILPYYLTQTSPQYFSLQKLSRQPLFVPEMKRIDEMFKEFQTKKVHIAIVVDEFGGTAGLVTLEDIIEEIMSKFSQSSQLSEYCKKIDENSYLIDAKIPIEDLEELLNENLTEGDADFDTLGGFIFHSLGEIPKENFHFRVKEYELQIKEVVNNRIISVLLTKRAS